MAGMGEDNVEEFGAAIEGEEPLRRYLENAREEFKSVTVEGLVTSMATLLPDVDRAVLTDEFGEDMVANLQEGMRVGGDGWLEDDLAFASPWGFDLSEIRRPTMIWQAQRSDGALRHGRWLAAHLPGASVHLEEGRDTCRWPSVRSTGCSMSWWRAEPVARCPQHFVMPRVRPRPGTRRVLSLANGTARRSRRDSDDAREPLTSEASVERGVPEGKSPPSSATRR